MRCWSTLPPASRPSQSMSSPLTYRCPSRESSRSWSCESNSAVPERGRDVPVVHVLTLVGSVRVQGIGEVQIQEKKSGLHHSSRGPSLDGQVNALSPEHTSAATRLGPDFMLRIQVNPSVAPRSEKVPQLAHADGQETCPRTSFVGSFQRRCGL